MMEALVREADDAGAYIVLSPTDQWGSSVPRLRKFYKRFGFIEAKSSKGDPSLTGTMQRAPTPRAADSLIESMPNEVYLHGNRMYRLMYRDLIRRGKEAGLIPEGMVVVEPESRVEGSSPDLIDQRRSLANWGDKIRKEKARPVSFGARLLDSGRKESAVRDNTTYSSWQGLLEGFLQRVQDFPDVFKNREVIVTNPSFEQVNVIWTTQTSRILLFS